TIHAKFYEALKSSQIDNLTTVDERLAILMYLKMTNKEMQSILAISESGLKRAKRRLKSKLVIPDDEYLNAFIKDLY
ncbi:MAG: hypothetical protein MRY83_09910, partial [Flavobacteriales bacterium]|nr:hypothetical protein [Flavobacteriales bacterium]